MRRPLRIHVPKVAAVAPIALVAVGHSGNETAPTEELPRAFRWMVRWKVPRSVPRLLPRLGRYRPQVER
jgi:hypothetical protein